MGQSLDLERWSAEYPIVIRNMDTFADYVLVQYIQNVRHDLIRFSTPYDSSPFFRVHQGSASPAFRHRVHSGIFRRWKDGHTGRDRPHPAVIC